MAELTNVTGSVFTASADNSRNIIIRSENIYEHGKLVRYTLERRPHRHKRIYVKKRNGWIDGGYDVIQGREFQNPAIIVISDNSITKQYYIRGFRCHNVLISTRKAKREALNAAMSQYDMFDRNLVDEILKFTPNISEFHDTSDNVIFPTPNRATEDDKPIFYDDSNGNSSDNSDNSDSNNNCCKCSIQ